MRKLTELSTACGCAAKLSPQILDAVLPRLPRSSDPNLLVGFEGSEDAAIYRLSPEQALVQTVDFFTPIVDEPADFGAIAAANALSDVYAMAGGLDMLASAGCVLGGGHSLRDPELKFGYSITGVVHPARVLRNAGARPGDRLYLTKPIGTGVITTAHKLGQAAPQHLAEAVRSMRSLNRAAAEAALACGAHAATDVTGFGLIGHAREMARASGVHLALQASAVPLLGGARAYALAPPSQGLRNNRAFAEPDVVWQASIPEDLRALLFDPQTSGGLLLSVPPEREFPAPCIGEAWPARAPAAGCISVL